MSLHLTRDEADRIAADGRGVLFRASEQCVRCGPPYGHCPHTVPPAEFDQAAQPCETCGGEGKLYCDGCGGHLCPDPLCADPKCPNPHYCPDDCDGVTPDCPDCIDGKRRIAAVVPCRTCAGKRIVQTYDGDLGHLTQPCPDCQSVPGEYEWSGATGFVTVGHVVVTSGPDQQDDGTYCLEVQVAQ